jgi:hypothetical protein
MYRAKIVGALLAVVLVIFLIAPIASAQPYDDILGGKWFKVKVGAKGYRISHVDDETVLGKGAGSMTAYLLFSFEGSSYTITTCTPDDVNPDQWYKITSLSADPPGPDLPSPRNSILAANIYGAVYPQVWDFQGIPLVLYNGITILTLYPTFYTKITADKANTAVLKSASISNVSCGLYADDEEEYAIGSCTLSGPLIPVAKVPAACLD